MSFELDLNGYYTYTSRPSLDDDGHSTFKLTVSPSGVICGSGSDKPGPFVISGALIGDDITFLKLYSNSSTTWKYTGKRIPDSVGNVFQFTGAWGPVNSDCQDGQWAFTGVATGATTPNHPTESQWIGNYFSGLNLTDNTHTSVNRNPSIPHSAGSSGLISIVGNGVDDVGSFKIAGTATSDRQWDITKMYDAQPGAWKCQGTIGPFVSAETESAPGGSTTTTSMSSTTKTTINSISLIPTHPSSSSSSAQPEASASTTLSPTSSSPSPSPSSSSSLDPSLSSSLAQSPSLSLKPSPSPSKSFFSLVKPSSLREIVVSLMSSSSLPRDGKEASNMTSPGHDSTTDTTGAISTTASTSPSHTTDASAPPSSSSSGSGSGSSSTARPPALIPSHDSRCDVSPTVVSALMITPVTSATAASSSTVTTTTAPTVPTASSCTSAPSTTRYLDSTNVGEQVTASQGAQFGLDDFGRIPQGTTSRKKSHSAESQNDLDRSRDPRFLQVVSEVVKIMTEIEVPMDGSISQQLLQEKIQKLNRYLKTVSDSDGELQQWLQRFRDHTGTLAGRDIAFKKRKTSEDSKLFLCLWCLQTLTVKNNLGNHVRSHLKFPLSFCDLCDFSSVTPRLPTRHLKIHQKQGNSVPRRAQTSYNDILPASNPSFLGSCSGALNWA